MHSAKDSNRQVYTRFHEGNFSLRCMDRKWEGLALADLLNRTGYNDVQNSKSNVSSFYAHKFNFYINNARPKWRLFWNK